MQTNLPVPYDLCIGAFTLIVKFKSSSFYPDHGAVKCPSITIMQHYYAPSHENSPVLRSLTRDEPSLEAGPAQGASLLQHHLIPPHLSDQPKYLGIELMHDKRCKSTTGNQTSLPYFRVKLICVCLIFA